MKILLLGDYSNCHRTLATGLRRLGHEVTVVSDGSAWMDCERDIDITRSPGKLGGLALLWRLTLGPQAGMLKGYDVVAVNDLNFVRLKPQWLRRILDMLRRNNKSVFLTAMSTDTAYLDMLEADDSPLRYSEWFVDGKPSRMYLSDPAQWQVWHGRQLADYQRYALDHIDGAVSVLYEYHLGMERALGAERAAYGGIPIDIDSFPPVDIPRNPGRVKIFLGRDCNRMLMKGSDLLEDAARRVVDMHPDKAQLEIVENVPYSEFVSRLRDSHLVLDQIYSYTPATTALMAMASGIPVVSGGEPEYYEFIGEYDNRPIVNAALDTDSIARQIEQLVLDHGRLSELGRQSRRFVEKHNDSLVVARRFLDFWTKNQHL